MTASARATLGYLPQADGSAFFSQGRTQIIASVNGPIEVRPRDELPQEAFVELTVRPSAGVTSVREKFLESRILSALKPIILRSNHPRTLIQVTIQIVQSADEDPNAMMLLSPALNAASLALMDAGVPLKCMLSSTTIALIGRDVVIHPEVKDVKRADSVHVFAFGLARWFDSGRSFKKGMELAFLESQGRFDIEDLETIGELAKNLCSWNEQEEMLLDGSGDERIGELMQEWVREKIERDLMYRK